MNVIMMKPSDLRGYKNNARTHSTRQINQIIESIKAFGFNVPVEVSDSLMILSGHARVEAAIKMKLREVPVLIQSHLTDMGKQKAYILAANKIALNSGWDYRLLESELRTLGEDYALNVSVTGFTAEELAEFMGKNDFDPGLMSQQGELDKLHAKMVTCPHCEHEFNLNDA